MCVKYGYKTNALTNFEGNFTAELSNSIAIQPQRD